MVHALRAVMIDSSIRIASLTLVIEQLLFCKCS
jgi:hypothetical protein